MIVATAVASIAIFVVALWLSRVIPASAGVLTTAQDAVAVMRDQRLDDRARERAIQKAALRLFSDFASIVFRGVLSVAASLVPIWLVDVMGLAASSVVIDFLSRWDVMLVTTAVMIAGYLVWSRLWRSS